MNRLRSRLPLGAVAVLGLGLLVVPEARASAAGNPNTYTVSAAGDGLQVTEVDPSFVVETVAASPYGAASSIDSVGDSGAGAGAPYSPLVASAPGTLDGLQAGTLPPLPPVPGEVTASYPTQTTSNDSAGPYSLSASSTRYAATADARVGEQPAADDGSSFFATASSQALPDGSVDAQASTGADLVDVGGLIDIASVSSSAKMTEQASQKPTISSSTDLGTVTAVGKVTGLTGAGLQVLGTDAPVNITPTVLPVLNSALSATGIRIAYVPEEYVYTDGTTSTGTLEPAKTVESVDSGALQVSISETVPGQGLVTVMYTLARTYVSTTDTPGGSITGTPGVESSVPAGQTTGVTAQTPESSGSPLPVSESHLEPAPAVALQAVPTAAENITGHPGGIPPAERGTPSTSLSRPEVAALAEFGVGRGDTESLYLILVAGALAALAMSYLARFLAVRLHLSDEPKTRTSPE